MMSRFIEGEARSQSVLFPERLEDWIAEDNPVRAVEAFVEELDLGELGICGGRASRDRTAGIPPGDAPQDLHLWVSEPDPVQPSAGARDEPQRRTEVADGST